MGDAEPINEWARLLDRIAERPGWSTARLARESGVHKSTIYRWKQGSRNNITLESIKLIADAAGIDMIDALRAAATIIAPAAAERLERDDAERAILESNASPAQKKMMLERYHRRLTANRQAALDDVREQIELLRNNEAAS